MTQPRKQPARSYNYVTLPPVILNLDRPDHRALLKRLVRQGYYHPRRKRKTVGYGRLIRQLLARHLGVPLRSRQSQVENDPSSATDDLAAGYACADWSDPERS